MYGIYFVVVLFLGSLISTVVWLASKNGSKQAQLEALKAELRKQAEEQRRAQQIKDYVGSLATDDARKRLHQIANKQF